MSSRSEDSEMMRTANKLESEITELDEKIKGLRTKVKTDPSKSQKYNAEADKFRAQREELEKKLSDIKKHFKKKIISVTMSQALVSRIDDLVQERVGRSRAQLIEDAVRWFLDYTVHKWNERGIYVNSLRMALESETLTSLFFSKLTPTEQYELGLTAGSQAPIADVIRLFHAREPHDPSSRELVLSLLQDNGWGLIDERDDMIVVGSPFYPAPFIRGYLESLLRKKIELVETMSKDNVALRIQE